MGILILISWIGFSFVACYIATTKGRSGIGFFFLAFLLSPIVGIIAAAAASPNVQQQAVDQGKKKCPQCAEFVQPEAKICRFCQHSFVAEVATVSPADPTPPVKEGISFKEWEAKKPEKSSPAANMFLVFILVALFGGVIWASLALSHDQSSAQPVQAQPITVPEVPKPSKPKPKIETAKMKAQKALKAKCADLKTQMDAVPYQSTEWDILRTQQIKECFQDYVDDPKTPK